jgi:hypothetical protein
MRCDKEATDRPTLDGGDKSTIVPIEYLISWRGTDIQKKKSYLITCIIIIKYQLVLSSSRNREADRIQYGVA